MQEEDEKLAKLREAGHDVVVVSAVDHAYVPAARRVREAMPSTFQHKVPGGFDAARGVDPLKGKSINLGAVKGSGSRRKSAQAARMTISRIPDDARYAPPPTGAPRNPNRACECGSGKKYKKCCGPQRLRPERERADLVNEIFRDDANDMDPNFNPLVAGLSHIQFSTGGRIHVGVDGQPACAAGGHDDDRVPADAPDGAGGPDEPGPAAAVEADAG